MSDCKLGIESKKWNEIGPFEQQPAFRHLASV